MICWPHRGHLQLHDHGGASGAFEVIQGTLEERCVRSRGLLLDGGSTVAGAGLRDRTVGVGQPVAFDGRYIHDVRNAADPVTTSVHIYSAASRPMSFYRLDGGLIRTVALGEERSLIEAEVAAERGSAAPARRDHFGLPDRHGGPEEPARRAPGELARAALKEPGRRAPGKPTRRAPGEPARWASGEPADAAPVRKVVLR